MIQMNKWQDHQHILQFWYLVYLRHWVNLWFSCWKMWCSHAMVSHILFVCVWIKYYCILLHRAFVIWILKHFTFLFYVAFQVICISILNAPLKLGDINTVFASQMNYFKVTFTLGFNNFDLNQVKIQHESKFKTDLIVCSEAERAVMLESWRSGFSQ